MPALTAAEFDSLLAFAHHLAEISAEAILPHFRRAGGPVDNKSREGLFDPVTAADRDAERVIRAAVEARYPAHGFRGEEFGNAREDAEFCWLIDPIDGTRSFIMGLPVWGTLIGLTIAGEPVLGIMQQPFTGERYWSGRDASHYRGVDGERTLRTRTCETLAEAIFTTTSPDLFRPGHERDGYERISGAARMRRFGGDCYCYTQVAAGHIDLIVEAGLRPFDIVALIPIVERAGGRVTAWDGTPAHAGGRVIACGDPRLLPQALERLAG
jgi:myo-inositol-1(or 4)-monophosphatase